MSEKYDDDLDQEIIDEMTILAAVLIELSEGDGDGLGDATTEFLCTRVFPILEKEYKVDMSNLVGKYTVTITRNEDE